MVFWLEYFKPVELTSSLTTMPQPISRINERNGRSVIPAIGANTNGFWRRCSSSSLWVMRRRLMRPRSPVIQLLLVFFLSGDSPLGGGSVFYAQDIGVFRNVLRGLLALEFRSHARWPSRLRPGSPWTD